MDRVASLVKLDITDAKRLEKDFSELRAMADMLCELEPCPEEAECVEVCELRGDSVSDVQGAAECIVRVKRVTGV